MPRFVRSASLTRAIVLGAACLASAVPAQSQSAPSAASARRATIVVFLPTRVDSVAASRIRRTIGGRDVVAVYTTDSPTAYRAAQALHVQFGGSLIPYDRLSRPASDFGNLLFHNAVEYAAREHLGQAVLVVAETDLTLPFLRRAVSPQTLDSELEKGSEDGFLITLGTAGSRSVTLLPF